MPADIPSNFASWSATAASNAPSGTTAIGTNLDDNLRELQAVLRATLATQASIASAATTDIGAQAAGTLTITGTTTITSLGVVSAGIRKRLIFGGALTLTHNATSLILPNAGANITTAAGDTCEAESLGSGNWRVAAYQKATGYPVSNATVFNDGTVGAPSITFSADTDTGICRIGANSLGIAAGGALAATFSSAAVTLASAGSAAVSSTSTLAIDAGTTLTMTSGGGAALTVSVDSTTSGTGGAVAITAGETTDSAANGGAVTITGGVGGPSGSAVGGNVALVGGARGGGGTTGGGDVVLTPGSQSGTTLSGSVRVTGGNGDTLKMSGYRQHLELNNNASARPTITSGAGAGATITGSDNAFRITFGTGAGTTIVVTFAKSWAFVPMCHSQCQSTLTASRAVTTTSDVTITLASAPSNGDVLDVFCLGRSS